MSLTRKGLDFEVFSGPGPPRSFEQRNGSSLSFGSPSESYERRAAASDSLLASSVVGCLP